MAFVIPVGINWADGTTVLRVQPNGASGTPTIVGTPLPTGQVEMYYGGLPSDLIQEMDGSPEIERAEQCTCRHELKMPYTTGISYWSVMGRGTMVTDTAGNIWRILSCNIKRLNEPCVIGVAFSQTATVWCNFSYVAESISFDSPPDDFDVQEVSLDLDIIKHPRYAWALSPYASDAATYSVFGDTNQKVYYSDIKNKILANIEFYRNSPQVPLGTFASSYIQDVIKIILAPDAAGNVNLETTFLNQSFDPTKAPAAPVYWNGSAATRPAVNCRYFNVNLLFNLNTTNNPVAIAIAAATELISKLWRNEDTPYIAGYKVIWTQKVFSTVYLNPGGYIEDPRQVVPQYFMNPFNNGVIPRSYSSAGIVYDSSAPDSNASIFDLLPIYNPQCYSVTGRRGGSLSFSALRTTDTIRYDRTFFDLTHSWMVACVGKWDSDLFTQNNRPQVSSDFNNLPV